MIRDRAGVTAAAPAEQVEHSSQAKLLGEMRVTLARLRQAGMATDELLRVMRREVRAMDVAARRNDDD
jgi:hypothetical protein